jgi:hypothetical protein
MDELQIKLNSIGEAIFQTYLFSPPLTPPEPEPEAAPEQTQSQKQEKTTAVA